MSLADDHSGMEVLSSEECDRLLATTPVGRVAFVADGEVVVLPVTYRWHEHSVVFRTTRGAKLEAAAAHSPVSFEIDDWDPDSETGWSVLVKGVAAEVFEESEAGELTELGLKPWADAVERRRWVRIRPDEITGRKIG